MEFFKTRQTLKVPNVNDNSLIYSIFWLFGLLRLERRRLKQKYHIKSTDYCNIRDLV